MTAANPSHALALVVVDELVRCGVTDAVLAPGSRSTALAMALHDEPRIRLHVEVDERSAGFLAIGYARAAGRPAVVVTTSGTATANLHPAVVEADTGGVPLLVLTADRPPEERHTGSNQTIDQLRLYGDAVRWFCEVGVAEDRPGVVPYWRSSVSRAVAEARGLGTGPGPVHLNLAFREPTVPATDDGRSRAERPFSQELTGRPDGRSWVSVTAPAPRGLDESDLAALAGRVAAADRGLLVVGATATPPAPALELADRAGWPVVAEPVSGVRSGPNVIASAHHLLSNERFAAAHVPDLVLRIGRTGLSRAVARHLPPHVPQVLIDPHGGWHDPARSVADLVIADPAGLCAALVGRLPDPTWSPWVEGWREADARARAATDAVLDAEAGPSEPRTARDLAASLPHGSVLVVASSMPVRDLDLVMAPRDGLRVVANRGASGIDGFVSTVLGAALADVGPVTALAGDLSLLHDANGFLLSPADGVDAVLVVVDNDGGGIFSFLPQADYPASFERVFGTPHGRDLADLARLHDLGYVRVHRADELVPAVEGARAAGGVQLVHVRTDRRENVELHRRLQDAVDAVL